MKLDSTSRVYNLWYFVKYVCKITFCSVRFTTMPTVCIYLQSESTVYYVNLKDIHYLSSVSHIHAYKGLFGLLIYRHFTSGPTLALTILAHFRILTYRFSHNDDAHLRTLPCSTPHSTRSFHFTLRYRHTGSPLSICT